MSTSSRSSSLTPIRSPSPSPQVQPDHFYGSEGVQLPPSPSSDGKTWLDPEDDPLAHRGIPVFKPTMAEFEDFEAYVSKIECWGMKSGIVKVIPPKEWSNALPPLKEQLCNVKIRTPIEQYMRGSGGLFRQENMEKRKVMSVREWAELCAKEDFRAPGVGEVGLQSRGTNTRARPRRSTKKTDDARATHPGDPDRETSLVKEEPVDVRPMGFNDDRSTNDSAANSPSVSETYPSKTEDVAESKSNARKGGNSRQIREAERAAQDTKFLETFEPHRDWLPQNTQASDYTREFCQMLERRYWRNCGLGKPAWYGADTQGTLYTDDTTVWNVGKLPSALSRILPADNKGLPGVNTPYLYFGMWRATFAWHVEDMDLFSINYIHFGAPKFWYAIPQGRSVALERTMRGYFPNTTTCPQFLRHKSFLASPTLLAQASCRPNFLVQHSGEFVITFPRGYHAGFNLGFNCAESVNFALDSWIELGRRAKVCECVSDSVRIDVDQLLQDRAAEAGNPPKPQSKPKTPVVKKEANTKVKVVRKRHIEEASEQPSPKKLKIKLSPSKSAAQPKLSITLKFSAPEPFPCCLCVSMDKQNLLRVSDPPIGRKDIEEAAGNPKEWMAHEYCAKIVPETWVDEIEIGPNGAMERVIFGVDGIVRDRWHLKCAACAKSRPKAHGAPIQCTKGKCSKAFHVSCARDNAESGIKFSILKEVEKEVLLIAHPAASASSNSVTGIGPDSMQVDTITSPADMNGIARDPVPSQVLKAIKKLEVQVLCAQHNPEVAAAKKEAKQDKIKTELLALPEMARIKLRVSSGVFEVSLIRVNEASRSVEVLWDKGEKREFKWNSVIFGNTDSPVQKKPSELLPKAEPVPVGMPVPTFSSVGAAAASRMQYLTNQASTGSETQTANASHAYPSSYSYPPHTGPYDYWQYHAPYGYPGYYSASPTVAGAPPHYSAYAYPYNQYHTAQYNWQQPVQGQLTPGTPSIQQQSQQASLSPGKDNASNTQPPVAEPLSASAAKTSSKDHPSGTPPDQEADALSPEVQKGLCANLAALLSMQPGLLEILKDNPHLRQILAAVTNGQTDSL